MSRRAQIQMSKEEVAAFLGQQRTVTCATLGPRGWPHLVPLWYVLRDAETGESVAAAGAGEATPAAPRVWAWTYAASQKVRNLERAARATLQVEAGEQYQELRGVMLECDVQIHRERETVGALGNEIFCRRLAIEGIADRPAAARGEPPVPELPPEVAAMIDKQAAKRVALEFVERRRVSWDHRKLGGVY